MSVRFLSSFSKLNLLKNCLYQQKNMSSLSQSTLIPNNNQNYLVWLDCEMSGLNLKIDKLLEVAIILTDNDLNVLETLGPLQIHQSKAFLDQMNDWCKQTHHKTGLTNACLSSKNTIEQVDDQISLFLDKHKLTQAVLAGNSIHSDRNFIAQECPKFNSRLTYRMLDVSSFKIAFQRWNSNKDEFKKKNTHRALDDILESINELKYYKNFFKI